jgi:hypothetical protein
MAQPYEYLIRIRPDGSLSGAHRQDYLEGTSIPSGDARALPLAEVLAELQVLVPAPEEA